MKSLTAKGKRKTFMWRATPNGSASGVFAVSTDDGIKWKAWNMTARNKWALERYTNPKRDYWPQRSNDAKIIRKGYHRVGEHHLHIARYIPENPWTIWKYR